MWKRKPQYGIFIHISVVKSQFSFVINCSKIVHAWHNPLKKELVKPPQGDFGITPPNLSMYILSKIGKFTIHEIFEFLFT